MSIDYPAGLIAWWSLRCDHQGCEETFTAGPRGLNLETFRNEVSPLARVKGWFAMSDTEHYCPKHAPNPCDSASGECEGDVTTQEDPLLADLYDLPGVMITMCAFHLQERADDI